LDRRWQRRPLRRIEGLPGTTKIVFCWEWPGTPERESLVTFLLESFDGGTELTLIHKLLPDEETRKSHEDGWKGFLNKLQLFLGDLEWAT
jgi:uncharacterized protein YndB with AHSA1/START domain